MIHIYPPYSFPVLDLPQPQTGEIWEAIGPSGFVLPKEEKIIIKEVFDGGVSFYNMCGVVYSLGANTLQHYWRKIA